MVTEADLKLQMKIVIADAFMLGISIQEVHIMIDEEVDSFVGK